MAHATVTVCVATAPGEPVVDAVARVLEPFDMNGDAGADGRWDHWQIDGIAKTPGLPLKAGSEPDPRVLRISEPSEGWLPGRCDGAPRSLLNFEIDRAVARQELEAAWAQWYDIVRQQPPARPLSEFLSRYRADPTAYSLDDARRDHRNQPLLQAHLTAHGLDPDTILWQQPSDPVYHYGYDRDWFIRRLAARETATPELLTLDGTWSDSGDFSTGMFDEAAHDRYYIAADEYLEQLAPEVYVVRVYIHC